jgi:hypothetical protein
MTNKEERMKVLEMVRDGVISAEEAAQLLETMGLADDKPEPKKPEFRSSLRKGKGRTFRVRVTDTDTNKTRVNVSLPMSLVNVAIKTGAKFAPEIDGIDMEEIFAAIDEGATGKIVDVMDGDDGEHVEVFIE